MTVKRELFFDYSHFDSAATLLSILIKNKDIVVLCIGSDRLIGDSLGPLCGQYLKHTFNTPCFVYGCLDNPINALNLMVALHHIKKKHANSIIIAVDSMIGKQENIGKCKLIYGGIYPGSADGKILPLCGDIALTAIISSQPLINPIANQSIRLGLINHLAYTIAQTIHNALTTVTKIDLPTMLA